ncbi:hypothetical protein D1872_352010 [compost metagenome]
MVFNAFRIAAGDIFTHAQYQQKVFDYLMTFAALLRQFFAFWRQEHAAPRDHFNQSDRSQAF